MNRYSIEEQTLDTVLRYLAEQPYKEVAPIISSIQSGLKKIDEPDQTVCQVTD